MPLRFNLRNLFPQALRFTIGCQGFISLSEDRVDFSGRTEKFGIAGRNRGCCAKFLSSTGEVYAVFGQRDKALASYREAQSLWKKVAEIEPQRQVEADVSIGRLCLVQGNLYASSRDGRAEARMQYQRAIDILSKLKANNQVVWENLKYVREAQQKLQALAG